MSLLFLFGGDSSALSSRTSDPSLATTRPALAPLDDFARYIPADVGIYLQLTDREKWLAALSMKNDPSSAQAPATLESLIHQSGGGLVLAMPSWADRKQAVLLCRPDHPKEFLGRIVAADATPIHAFGAVAVYQIEKSLFFATNERVFIFSEHSDPAGLLMQSTHLLAGQTQPSLADHSLFQNFVASVPPDASGFAFINRTTGKTGDLSSTKNFLWFPHLTAAGLTLELGPSHILCRLRAWRRHPEDRPAELLAPEFSPPLFQGAIFGIHVRTSPGDWLASWQQHLLPSPQSAFFRDWLSAILAADVAGELTLAEWGPQVSAGLFQATPGESAEWAVIIENHNAAETAQSLVAITEKVVTAANRASPQDPPVAFSQSEHSGQNYYRLQRYQDNHPDPATLGLAEHYCFWGEAANNRLVLGGPENLFKILIDQIKNPPPPESLQLVHKNTTAEFCLRPAELAQVLEPIQKTLFELDDPLLQQNEWVLSLRDRLGDAPAQLGARLSKDGVQRPGKVLVIDVLAGWPADGLLKPGDAIIGIDGQLLSLQGARDDLRKKLRAATAGRCTLRVERSGAILEIPVELRGPVGGNVREFISDLAQAIDHLALIGKKVDRITYKQLPDKAPDQLLAEIELHLRTPLPQNQVAP